MVKLHNSEGEVINVYPTAMDYDYISVTFSNDGYLAKIYANIEVGEYFFDEDNPVYPEKEIELPIDVPNLFSILRGESE